MSDVPFQDTTRIDARDKVRGKALFGADDARPDMVHAALAVATIGKGRIVSLDTRAAAAVSGVRLVLTHRDLGDVKSAGFLMAGGYGFQSLQPMLSPAIAYRGLTPPSRSASRSKTCAWKRSTRPTHRSRTSSPK
jgi:xanthine dehydrogenase YagR molybdenum-binding subunit